MQWYVTTFKWNVDGFLILWTCDEILWNDYIFFRENLNEDVMIWTWCNKF